MLFSSSYSQRQCKFAGKIHGQLSDGVVTYSTTPLVIAFTGYTYTYGNSAHKHAVTALSSGESYTYDANGNMITRVEGGVTYTQTFDAENRLISVTVNSQTTQFIYAGDGNLVKKIKPDGSKTLYVGAIYEVDKNSGGSVTGTKTYYPAAGAMRVGSTLYYVLKDHLGSASVLTNTSGTVVAGADTRYYPFGEARFSTSSMLTDKLFTGQREITGLGIYHYGARFYSPKLGRFLSADTIVPSYANPQNLNRFSYVTNNPLRFIDPTGHRPCEDYEGSCVSENQVTKIHKAKQKRIKEKSRRKNTGRDGLTGIANGPTIGPLNPSIGPAPEQPRDPGFSEVIDSGNLLNNAADFVEDLGISTKLLRKGFVWAKAVNPNPLGDLGLGFIRQAISDLDNPTLTLDQRVKRASVVGVESLVTGVASDIAGGLGFLGGEAIVPSGGGVVGYAVAAIATSLYLDEVAWSSFNTTFFVENGLGGYP